MNLHFHIDKLVINLPIEKIDKILKLVTDNNLKIKTIMATQQERFDALMARLDTVSNDIAADYAQLIEEAKKGQVSEESFAKAEANIAKLEALGASVENPVPEDPGTGENPPA